MSITKMIVVFLSSIVAGLKRRLTLKEPTGVLEQGLGLRRVDGVRQPSVDIWPNNMTSHI
jgi:hypothetical protein